MAKKYYGVKVGRVPGVYENWNECEAQVKGFKGAEYKSFADELSAVQDVGLKNETSLSVEDKEYLKWELNGLLEGLKERDVMFIINKVKTISEILDIEMDEINIEDFKRR